jgi:hypothetical protein
MANLFGRELSLNIGGTLIRTKINETGERAAMLRVTFNIVRSRTKEPNTAEISVYNLSQDTRSLFQEKDIPTVLEAGYTDNISQIFGGQLDFAKHKFSGTDWVTTLQASDSGKAFRSQRINTSIKGPIPIGDALRAAAQELGVGLGNLADKISKGSIRGTLTEFANGIVLSGKAEKEFDKILKSMGYSWSIQDGELQLLEPTEVIGDSAVLLTPGTGMIGSPEPGEKGFVTVRSLLQPELTPGKKIKIQSKNDDINGFYRVEKVTFLGDSSGNDWYADVEGKPL